MSEDWRVRRTKAFWPKVDRDGPVPVHCPDLGQCWIWTSGRLGKGYGSFRWLNQQTTGAHRVAWEIEHGESPGELHVLHRCDNMLCVNPAHLFLGTNHENVLDMHAKGRAKHGNNPPRGDDHPHRKLSAAAVLEIRAAYESGGITHQSLADSYGVTRTVITHAINRTTWKSV